MHVLRSVSVLQVPQGYERGGGGVTAHHGKHEERGSVPASRTHVNSLKVGVQRRAG